MEQKSTVVIQVKTKGDLEWGFSSGDGNSNLGCINISGEQMTNQLDYSVND